MAINLADEAAALDDVKALVRQVFPDCQSEKIQAQVYVILLSEHHLKNCCFNSLPTLHGYHYKQWLLKVLAKGMPNSPITLCIAS